MATILLSAVGAAMGASLGGGVLGISAVVLGRAAGAVLGRAIDQRIAGAGSEPVETGRIDRLRLTGAGEGAPVARVYGRMRLAGQVIWSSEFREHRRRRRSGGKGAPSGPKVEEYSYSISLALALCEGPVSGVTRIWADGQELDLTGIDWRLHPGDEGQLPDAAIEAHEGAGKVPAWRGTAYVVFENLALGQFGNRVPQFSFEVFRPQMEPLPGVVDDPALAVRGIALMPGSGEYALASSEAVGVKSLGEAQAANLSTPSGRTDLVASLDMLQAELPRARSALLVVSWFGDDLRAGACRIEPRFEPEGRDARHMPWTVSGLDRATAASVPTDAGAPVYGGTPADASVVEAIRELSARGMEAVFYPFVLMCQQAGNGLPDPYSGAEDQPVLPWRGRITTSVAAGREGSPDGTAAAAAEVAAFFGTAEPGDFSVSGGAVAYAGPAELSYRRFVLHYAHLCVAAGGVNAFCIGSELRGVTRIRGAGGSYPAVEELRRLAADCRAILGPQVKIGYAADWSEYFGHHPGGDEVIFHLDPLWADPDCDFVGIDNYMPLSDWRAGDDHADAGWGSVYNLDYLAANVAGGEGFDWYYHAPEARAAQLRSPITDGAHGEDWVWRYKDLAGWWSNPHHDRPGGVRSDSPTGWVPGMKPIWFTEIGCPAVDLGSNQPNVFWDPKSSESQLPYGSDGRRDDLIQMQYLRATLAFWNDPAHNPVSALYGGAMVDPARIHVWCWDARPFPAFPARSDLWADAANYPRGHWLNGRGGARSLASVAAELCIDAGIRDYDVSKLYGLVRGYVTGSVETGRAALQPLALAFGFDAVERGGRLEFHSRGGAGSGGIDPGRLVAGREGDIERVRAPEAEVSGRVRLSHVDAGGDYETRTAEAIFPDEEPQRSDQRELPLALIPAEARGIAERWLAESRIARDSLRFALPPSRHDLAPGDLVRIDGADWRIDRMEVAGALSVEAVRSERSSYLPSDSVDEPVRSRPYSPVLPVHPLFLDLPLLKGDEVPHQPHVAVTARPWPGTAAVFSSDQDDGYELALTLPEPAVVGVCETAVPRGPVGLWDRGAVLRVRLVSGELEPAGQLQVLNGANVAMIGDGSPGRWEVIQFCGAELVAPQTWELRMLLRGQAGSDALMPQVWPAGSLFVLHDTSLRQLPMPEQMRGLARHYRIGPAVRDYGHPSYTHLIESFAGNGLRPLSPVHLRERLVPGGRSYGWVRRGRLDADSWEGTDIPPGETREAWRVRVIQAGTVLREVATDTPAWTYTDAMIAADGASGAAVVAVAQVSERYGPGPDRLLGITI